MYEWYFLNKLARFETATSDVERYVLRRLLKTLPERWRLELDDATRARLQAVDSALIAFSEDDALQREIAAHDAFDKALRADEAQRVGDLSEIIQQYGEVADRYPNTQFGQRAPHAAAIGALGNGRALVRPGSAGFQPAKRNPAGKMPALPGRWRYSQTPCAHRKMSMTPG